MAKFRIAERVIYTVEADSLDDAVLRRSLSGGTQVSRVYLWAGEEGTPRRIYGSAFDHHHEWSGSKSNHTTPLEQSTMRKHGLVARRNVFFEFCKRCDAVAVTDAS